MNGHLLHEFALASKTCVAPPPRKIVSRTATLLPEPVSFCRVLNPNKLREMDLMMIQYIDKVYLTALSLSDLGDSP